MKRDVMRKWVKALESGEYKQTIGSLQNDGGSNAGFCCLGVLCKVAEKEGVKVCKDHGLIGGSNLEEQPDVVMWAGLKEGSPFCKINQHKNINLIAMNDEENKSFEEIAAVIRKNYKKL